MNLENVRIFTCGHKKADSRAKMGEKTEKMV